MSIRLQPAINVFQAVRPASTPALHVVSAQEPRVSAANPWGSAPASAYQSLHPGLLFGARGKKNTAGLAEPSLAVNVELTKVRYPILMSPKMDGNRGMVQGGKILSRGLLPIPNEFVSKTLSRPELEGFDGELICGDPTDEQVLSTTNSLLKSKNGTGDLRYYVFDVMNAPDKTLTERQAILKARHAKLPKDLKKFVKLMPQVLVHSEAEVKALEKKWVEEEGYEGAVLRNPDSVYKNTRSSMGDQGFMKMKRYEDKEALFVDCYPLTPQSTAGKTLIRNKIMTKEEMLALTEDTQGAAGFIVKDIASQKEFKLSAPAMNLEERRRVWKSRKKLVNQFVKYKSFDYGVKEDGPPRHGTFLGFRPEFDLPKELQTLAKKFKKVKTKTDEAA